MYIRTKDGRILDFDKLNEVSKLSIDMAEEPIRQADTIEELCDEFVIEILDSEDENVNQIRFPEFQWAKEEFEKFTLYDTTLYGAIRVFGKGLIYVAKMDSEGKLELI